VETLIEIKYAVNTILLLLTGSTIMFMAAGFAMLEAGLVRAKSTVEILTKNISLYALACLMYLLMGYAIMYPAEIANSLWPGMDFLLPGEHTPQAILDAKGRIQYSTVAHFFFQMVFSATSMSIVSGAVAERMKLWAFLLFAVIQTGIIYPLEGFWSWGGGFLHQLGYYDFSGSGVVHLTGAMAALSGVLFLGPRLDKYRDGEIFPIPGANLPLSALGTLILWFGWFGFNGGTVFMASNGWIEKANAMAMVIVNTNLAGAAGAIAALAIARFLFGTADLTMALSGIITALVAITASPLTPSPAMAVFIGAIAGVLVVFVIVILERMQIDDPVGAIAVHGVGGLWGLLAVCLSNPAASLKAQLIGIVTLSLWGLLASGIVWYLLRRYMGIRISENDEEEGIDIGECGLEAYPDFTPRS
jgi:ammonium transporter, Amt family